MKKYIYFLLLGLLFANCKPVILSLITPKNVENSLKVMDKNDQRIVFMPMVHLAKPIFFNQVKIVIDSLKKEGYTVYYEQISIHEKQGQDLLDINLRKLRKMFGFNIYGGYDNENNKSLPNFTKNKKYISQENEKLGLDSLDIIADVTLGELLNAHEKNEGKINLTDCDYNTKLNEKYKCEKVVSKYYAVHTYRDSIASNIVLKSNKQKSLLIYGKGHWYGIWPFFRDNGFVLKK